MALQQGFRLNMRLLADTLERRYIKIEYYARGDRSFLNRVGIYDEGIRLKNDVVYLIRAEQWQRTLAENNRCSFIILGRLTPELIPADRPMICVLDDFDLFCLLDLLQDIFLVFERWNQDLQRALLAERPLDAILAASISVFRNPMFIHDQNFNVLSYAGDILKVHTWSQNPKTGRDVVNMGLRNDFQLDQEYLDGLNKREAVLFSANQRGYPILYRNLYDENRYLGRVLVDELENVIQPGDYAVMDYLGDFLQEAIKKSSLQEMEYGGLMSREFTRILDGENADEQNVRRILAGMKWGQEDDYCCLKIVPDQPEAYLVSNAAIAERLHVLLPECIIFSYRDGVVILINRSRTEKTVREIVTGLAVFLRDNLLKLGISSEYEGFFFLKNAYRQADIAVSLGRRSDSMYWYYYFDHFLLDYTTDTMLHEMPLALLSADALHDLKKYDTANHTELYQTLKVYLRLERNMLQTARTLFIHRSTLSYRIERIQNITGVDLDSPRDRLKLLFSFELEEAVERSL